METTLQIDPALTPWLDRMVKEYGHNRLYWLMEAARAGRENVEDAMIADRVMEEIRQGRDAPTQTKNWSVNLAWQIEYSGPALK